MKKLELPLIGIIFFLWCMPVFSGENRPASESEKRRQIMFHSAFSPKWTFLQLSTIPVFLFDPEKTDVCGINAGLLTFQHNVYGVTAALSGMVKEHSGIMASAAVNLCGKSIGISFSPVNMICENYGVSLGIFNVGLVSNCANYGLQIGLINEAEHGLQIGLLNCNENSLIPYLPLINFSFPEQNKH